MCIKGHYQVKRQITEEEKIFANHLIKDVNPEYINNSYNATEKKKKKNMIQKGEKVLNRNFFKSDIQPANKHMKRLLSIREMLIKTTVRYHSMPIRMAMI